MKKRTMITALCLLMALTYAFKTAQSGYGIGSEVADFKLKSTEGEWISFESYPEAKGFIVVFTCNHCPYANLYDSRLIDLHNTYSPKGYPVLAINPNDAVKYPGDSYDSMVYFAKEKGYTFPYLHDESQEIARAFGAQKTPHVYLVNKHKKGFKVAYIGAIDNNYKDPNAVTERYVENAIQALLQNKKIEVKETKAIGCTIKWKDL